MQSIQQRYLVRETLVASVVNALLNSLSVWLIFGSQPALAFWGPQGVALDLALTVFITGFLMTLLLTLSTRGRLHTGALPGWQTRGPLRHLQALPNPLAMRALLLGAVVGLLLTPLLILPLEGLLNFPLSVPGYLMLKAGYGVLLGCLLAPPILLAALQLPVPLAVDIGTAR